jgi:hypothetical protein
MIQSNPGIKVLGGSRGRELDLTRQLSFLTNNYKYDLGEDPENSCIMIPRYRAGGRVSPDGNRYPDKEMKADENDLVPVRSIITKFRNSDIVTPDCLSLRYKDLVPGSGIGSSFGTSVTEAITQSALGLKHGIRKCGCCVKISLIAGNNKEFYQQPLKWLKDYQTYLEDIVYL